MKTQLQQLKNTFSSQKTRPLDFRKEQLQNLDRLLVQHESDFFDSLFSDLGKSHFESYATEIGFVRAEIKHVLKNLKRWLKPKSVKTPLVHQLGKSFLMPEPLGLVLIIGPWNYPVQLMFAPLIGAIAAGNCVVLKPSEVSQHTSSLIARLVPQYLDTDCVTVIEGDAHTTETLLQEKWDHIFFTGSSAVGKRIMQAAALHMTPVTLELGGKSPCIVDENVNLELCARRIAWGKFLNAGQTCIAPDYVLVHRSVQKTFLKEMQNAIHAFYGENAKLSKDFGRIVNDKHLQRLKRLLEGNVIFCGGKIDEGQRYISPTILTDVDGKAPVMQEEIFGPILPVLPVKSIEDAIAFVNSNEKPLALYLFSNHSAHQKMVLQETSSGGVCLNDTISHVAIPELPFGGIGHSGLGSYHGHASIKTFSHFKPVFVKNTAIDIPVRYPTYSENKLKAARWFL